MAGTLHEYLCTCMLFIVLTETGCVLYRVELCLRDRYRIHVSYHLQGNYRKIQISPIKEEVREMRRGTDREVKNSVVIGFRLHRMSSWILGIITENQCYKCYPLDMVQ